MHGQKNLIINIFAVNFIFAVPIGLGLTFPSFQLAFAKISEQHYLDYKLYGLIMGLLKGPIYNLSAVVVLVALALSVVCFILSLLFPALKLKPIAKGFSVFTAVIRLLALCLFLMLLGLNLYLCLSPGIMKPKGPNVLLIGIDTLRADHLSCYGYKRQTTPILDELAQRGILFREAISHIPSTTSSFASILTSKTPIAHGVLRNNTEGFSLDNWHVTLAEVLKNEGYATAAFVSGWTMKRNGNLTQGFDVYGDDFAPGKVRSGERRAGEVNQKVFDWLKKHHKEKFFLFVHYFDPHGKYRPPNAFKKIFDPEDGVTDLSVIQDPEKRKKTGFPLYLITQYDSEIRYCDHEIGQLIKRLSDYGIKDDTLIIVTSDHGETLIEHFRWWDHGRFVYDEQIHVPLIFSHPSLGQGARIDALVRLIDIFPTVLEILNIDFNKDLEGLSLRPLMKGEKDKIIDELFSESARGDSRIFKDDIEGVKGKKFCVRNKEWKLIWVPKTTGAYYELYDLKADPNEMVNLWGQGAEIEARFKQKLDAYVSQYKNSPYYFLGVKTKRPKKFSEDKELMDVFKSLGYL